MRDMILAVASVCVLLTGCSALLNSTLLTEIDDPERIKQVTGIDKHSSYPSVRRDSFEKINLLELVDPENRAVKLCGDDCVYKTYQSEETGPIAIGARYDLALAWFRQRKDISDEEKRRRRNSVQERMLSVSVSRCNVFKTYLRRDQADKNFLLGTATTVSAVLGAVLPGADAARYLAGTAGIFSGIRSEYNQAYFASLAAHVIAKGIETRQEIVYRRIQTEGQCKMIDAYPLEAAIKDAIYFDGLCSVVEGLDQASASVDATTEPGMDAAMRTVLRARLLKEAADMPREMLFKPETLDSIGIAGTRLGLSLVGSARGKPVKEEAETDLFIVATKMVDQINAAADEAVSEIEKEALDRKKALIDRETDAEVKKKLDKRGPKEGEIVKVIAPKLNEKLLVPLKLHNCYAKLASGAIEQRITAAKQLAKVKDNADRAAADLALRDAARAVAAASDKLRTKERLVLEEIDKYRKERVEAIRNVKSKTKEGTLDDLSTQAQMEPAGPVFSKSLSCAD